MAVSVTPDALAIPAASAAVAPVIYRRLRPWGRANPSAPPMKEIEDSLRFLMHGGIDYELRTTVVRQLHDEASITAMGRWLYELNGRQKLPKLFLQPFVQRDSVLNQNLTSPETAEITSFVEILSTFAEDVSIRG